MEAGEQAPLTTCALSLRYLAAYSPHSFASARMMSFIPDRCLADGFPAPVVSRKYRAAAPPRQGYRRGSVCSRASASYAWRACTGTGSQAAMAGCTASHMAGCTAAAAAACLPAGTPAGWLAGPCRIMIQNYPEYPQQSPLRGGGVTKRAPGVPARCTSLEVLRFLRGLHFSSSLFIWMLLEFYLLRNSLSLPDS
eukprot:COSAG01_NODE_495_length_16308_cov_92.317088_19_plen_195_part_00